MEVVGGATVQPDIHNVETPLGEEWETRSETLKFNVIITYVFSFNSPQKYHKIIVLWIPGGETTITL